MRFTKVLVVVSTASLLLTACEPSFITRNTLNPLAKGMPQKEAQEILGISPTGLSNVTVDGVVYAAEYFPMESAKTVQMHHSGGSAFGGGSSSSMYSTTSHHIVNIYLLYLNGRLRYWGMPFDYTKSEDLQMREVSKVLFKNF